MTTRIFRSCTIFVLGLAFRTIALADNPGLEGVWSVNVVVRDCQTQQIIRTVHVISQFITDGSMTQIPANTVRSVGVGTWEHTQANNFTESFWFFRFNPNGTVASTAHASNTMQLSKDGNHYTATGMVLDYDANNQLISTGCGDEAATRLP
jgi:hypothetical protein